MIYIKSFKNYEEFKELFGIVEHGNGVKSRKNKILLACLKDRTFIKKWLEFKSFLENTGRTAILNMANENDILSAKNMNGLKQFAKFLLGEGYGGFDRFCKGRFSVVNRISLADGKWLLHSGHMDIDIFNGLCQDGDTKAVRYISKKDDKVYKMKAGKFITRCIEDSVLSFFPEQLKRWLGEEFARDWQSYASMHVGEKMFTLNVDDKFWRIYDSDCCSGDFGSCMTDKGFHSFYRDSIDAKAASLQNKDGEIVARCIVYPNVYYGNGKRYRLAERQYAAGKSDVLKKMLVDALIEAGEIDGYKEVGAECHDCMNFVLNDGTSLQSKCLHIECHLEDGDTLSYQDSFKYYNEEKEIAYNDDCYEYDAELDVTCGEYRATERRWSDWNDEYIPDRDAMYDEFYDDYVYENQLGRIISGGRALSVCEDHAADDEVPYSEYEGCYIDEDEAVFIEECNDWYHEDDCVEDIDEVWRRKIDCVFSEFHDGWIYGDDAEYSVGAGDYFHPEYAAECPECEELYLLDSCFHSEITGEDYCCEECMLNAEKAWRQSHALMVIA